MPVITLQEVKNFMRIADSNVSNEQVIFVSREYHKLANKPGVSIKEVRSDTDYTSTAIYGSSGYELSTSWDGYTIIRRSTEAEISSGSTCYVNYTYNSYDADISRLIPIVQKDILNYLNNYFGDSGTKYGSMGIKVTVGTTQYLTDTSNSNGFSTAQFVAGMDIALQGSPKNYGVYKIQTISASSTKITLNTTELIKDTQMLNYVTLTRVRWPEDLKYAVAQIIWYNIDQAKNQNIQSKSLGPASVTYRNLSVGGYPENIYKMLGKYRNTKMR